MKGVNQVIHYYSNQKNKILKEVNNSNTLSVDKIIEYGEQLSVLEYKLTALEIVKEN